MDLQFFRATEPFFFDSFCLSLNLNNSYYEFRLVSRIKSPRYQILKCRSPELLVYYKGLGPILLLTGDFCSKCKMLLVIMFGSRMSKKYFQKSKKCQKLKFFNNFRSTSVICEPMVCFSLFCSSSYYPFIFWTIFLVAFDMYHCFC